MNQREELLRELAAARARLADLATQHRQAESTVERLRMQADGEQPNGRAAAHLPILPSGPAEKVRLFRTLFRGRPNVYPRLCTNEKKGTNGYAPACDNEWVRGVCEKPRVKCGECPHQAFLAVDDDVILAHIQGRHVVGHVPRVRATGRG